LTNTFLFGRF